MLGLKKIDGRLEDVWKLGPSLGGEVEARNSHGAILIPLITGVRMCVSRKLAIYRTNAAFVAADIRRRFLATEAAFRYGDA